MVLIKAITANVMTAQYLEIIFIKKNVNINFLFLN